jgi:hypothetical protein
MNCELNEYCAVTLRSAYWWPYYNFDADRFESGCGGLNPSDLLIYTSSLILGMRRLVFVLLNQNIPVSTIVGVDCVMDVKMKFGSDNPSADPC